jgi:hypothetical protein
MPFVFGHGLALRGRWGRVDGAVGIFSAGNLLARTTYTVTAWRSEGDLRRWMASAHHLRLMRDYRSYLESSSSVSWRTDAFEPKTAWREALARLEAARREDHCGSGKSRKSP